VAQEDGWRYIDVNNGCLRIARSRQVPYKLRFRWEGLRLQAGSRRGQRKGKNGTGHGLAFAANAGLTKGLALFAGPTGWALDAISGGVIVAGPAYRVTIPCVVQVAFIRQSMLRKQREERRRNLIVVGVGKKFSQAMPYNLCGIADPPPAKVGGQPLQVRYTTLAQISFVQSNSPEVSQQSRVGWSSRPAPSAFRALSA
jgi:hypothetical protein